MTDTVMMTTKRCPLDGKELRVRRTRQTAKRRRAARLDTLLEALTTIGLGLCFLLCGLLLLCAA